MDVDPSVVQLEGVARTLAITLRARAEEHARADALFADPWAADWFAQLPAYPDQAAWFAPVFQTSSAIRCWVYDQLTREFLASHPAAVVVELGAGLSTRYQRLGAPAVPWIELDLPEVLALRRCFEAETAQHRFLAASLSDSGWIAALPVKQACDLLLIAEGVLFFLSPEQVQQLIHALRSELAGATLAADVIGTDFSPATRAHFVTMQAPMRWSITETAELARLGLQLRRSWSTLSLFPERWQQIGYRFETVALRTGGLIVEASLEAASVQVSSASAA